MHQTSSEPWPRTLPRLWSQALSKAQMLEDKCGQLKESRSQSEKAAQDKIAELTARLEQTHRGRAELESKCKLLEAQVKDGQELEKKAKQLLVIQKEALESESSAKVAAAEQRGAEAARRAECLEAERAALLLSKQEQGKEIEDLERDLNAYTEAFLDASECEVHARREAKASEVAMLTEVIQSLEDDKAQLEEAIAEAEERFARQESEMLAVIEALRELISC